jgi:hypothetical protein
MTGFWRTNEMSRLSGGSTRTPGFGLALVALAAALAAVVLALSMLASRAEAAGHAGGGERKQQLNVVQCPTGGSDLLCVGTGAGDALIGRYDTIDWIRGGEGDDTYDGKGGCDGLYDASLTSSDRYLASVKDFCNVGISFLSIQDDGGNKDVLDLGGFYRSSDFALSKGYTNLYMDGPGNNDISIDGFFATGSDSADSVDTFRFSDKTLTARQVKDMIV